MNLPETILAFATFLTIVVALTALYALPTIIGRHRDVPNLASLTVINLLLGWTLLGWAAAMAMAVRDVPAHG